MVLGLRDLVNLYEGLRYSPLPNKFTYEKYTERWGIKELSLLSLSSTTK